METTDRKDIQTVAEDYFSSQNFINKKILEDVSEVRSEYGDSLWSRMSVGERDEAITERFLQSDLTAQYSKKETPNKFLSSFPKIKIRTGQKFIVEDSNTPDGKPYSYRDEHSSPFGWKTRSQQNLHFDIYSDGGRPEGCDVVTARRSAILSCPFGQYNKMPKVAKPVSIPVVPSLSQGNGQTEGQDLAEVTSLVSSVVIESENNIILDFSAKTEEQEEQEEITPETGRSESSSSSLLSKVMKKCKTPTLKRKKSMTSTDTLLSTFGDDQTPEATPARSSLPVITKPSSALPPAQSIPRPSAPPPPPPTTQLGPPPPPPERSPATRISSLDDESLKTEREEEGDKQISPLKKTGFDFLDNW